MALFKDDKEAEKVISEVKDQSEIIKKLSEEIKLLRKEVEFLSDLSKRNDEKNLKQDKEVHALAGKFKRILDVLEVDEKDL